MKTTAVWATVLFATSALAHDTFLVPDRFEGACGSATVHLTSGMTFPAVDYAVKPERLAKAFLYGSGKRTRLTGKAAAKSLDFVVEVPQQGTSVITVELAPKTLELTRKQVDEYLDEIAASEDIRNEWKTHQGRWRETYTKHAKTFLRCGEPDRQWIVAGDMDYEIVPQYKDPATLHAGDTLSVVLTGRKRRTNAEVPMVLVDDRGNRITGKRNTAGITEWTIPAPGRYMVAATVLRKSDGKDVDWVSDFTTLTFEIR